MDQHHAVIHTADFRALDCATSPHCGYCNEDKVYLDVERVDDYNDSDAGDIVNTPSRQSGFVSHVNSRRLSGNNIGVDGQEAPPSSLSDAKHLPKALTLPSDIWEDVFARLPPKKLAQLRGTCRLFRRYLLNESIWRASRKQFMPEMPKPVFKLKEWEMLALVKGSSCMICGNKAYPRAIYWAFRVRCCDQCFSKNVTKEPSLAESNFPAVLLTALPSGFVDASEKWVSNAVSPRPEGLTRVFWSLDLKSITERYEEARAMNAEEEWLKGLESEGSKNKVDVLWMEGFESRWFARGKGRPLPHPTKPSNQPSAIVNYGPKDNLPKLIWKQHRQTPHHLSHSHFPPQDHQCSSPVNSGVMPQHTRQHGQISLQQSRLIPAGGGRGGSWSGCYVTGQTTLPQKTSQPRIPAARTVTEAAEVRARRQKDIETRCLQLHPPITTNVLQHIPAYRASVLIAVPLTEQAWENLVPKLLEQREEAELKERVKVQSEVKLQELIEGQKAYEISQRELKEKKEREWDAVQAPVKEKLARYATEIINSWIAQHSASYHPSTNEESALRFAPEVLIHVRKRFYDENPYTLEDPNHSILVDPSISSLATGNRLLLENMKFVFDTKIKPITDKVRKELFICSGCSNNPKFYGFEGVIQHYAAKHTNLMSLGSVIVYWKADWPYYPPFILDPVAAVLGMGKRPSCASHRQPPFNDHPGTTPAFDTYNVPHRIGMHLGTHMEASHRVITSDYLNQGEHAHNVCASLSVPQPQYIQHKALIGTIGIDPALAASPGTNYRQLHIQRVHLEEIVVTSREAWFQLNGIKDLPSSVRVHYVIQNIVKVFQAKFPPLLLQLSMFIEALRDYQRMKPMRNVNGLQCLACATHPLHSKNTSSGMHPAGRVFTLLALVQHFEMIHVLRNKSSIKLDWKTQMIKLPEVRAIGMLRDAMGMDEEKLRLLKEVFPIAFNLPLPLQSSGSFMPSQGTFPILAQSISPSSSIADSSPSPLRSVETKDSSPISEGLSETPRRLSKTLSPLPTQDMVKRHASVEAEPKRKREARSPLLEVRSPKRAHISAAERFLENFLQDEEQKVDPCPIAKSVAKYEALNDHSERRKQRECDEYTTLEAEIQSHVRSFTRRSESPPTPIRLSSNSPTIDWYYRHLSPMRREEQMGRHASPIPNRHHFFDGHPQYITPLLPSSRSPRRGRSDGDISEGGDRLRYIHPYSPHSRSRSPQLCYVSPHSEKACYDCTYRVDMYPRDTLSDPRGYILDRYCYTDRMESPEPRHFCIGGPRYYGTARYFEDGRRTPPFELGLRGRAHEYGYRHPSSSHHHSITYNPYSLRSPISSRYPPYYEDRYVRETRSRSPECELSPKKPLIASWGTYHAQPSSLRGQADRQDEEDCHQMDTRYQELEFATSIRDCRNNPETQRFRGGYGGFYSTDIMYRNG